MRRELDEKLALQEGLADKPEIKALQVAQATMDELEERLLVPEAKSARSSSATL